MKLNSDEVGYTNKYVQFVKPKLLKRVMMYPLAGITTHWIFQGVLLMDRTERNFKILADLIMTFVLFIPLRLIMSKAISLIMAFLLAHSINFFFNGQIWVLLKHYGLVHQSREDYEKYVADFRARVDRETSIRFAAIFGSRVRDEWRASSDLDVRLVRRKGIINGVLGCFFVVKERTRALLAHFPLDIFLLDDFNVISEFQRKESPIILKDDELPRE